MVQAVYLFLLARSPDGLDLGSRKPYLSTFDDPGIRAIF